MLGKRRPNAVPLSRERCSPSLGVADHASAARRLQRLLGYLAANITRVSKTAIATMPKTTLAREDHSPRQPAPRASDMHSTPQRYCTQNPLLYGRAWDYAALSRPLPLGDISDSVNHG